MTLIEETVTQDPTPEEAPTGTGPGHHDAWFGRLAHFSARRRRPIMALWLLLALAAAPLAVTLTGALSGAGWEAQGSVAQEVRDELRRDFPEVGAEAAIVVYTQERPIAEDPSGLRSVVDALADAPGATSLVGDLAIGWDRLLAEGAAGAAATGTRVLTVAGSSDVAVVADRARLPDLAGGILHGHLDVGRQLSHERARDEATAPLVAADISAHRVLPGSHGGLLRTEAVHETVWRFLAGESVVASPGHVSTIVGREVGDAASTGAAIAHTLDRVSAPIRRVIRPPLAGWPAWCGSQPWCG